MTPYQKLAADWREESKNRQRDAAYWADSGFPDAADSMATQAALLKRLARELEAISQ